MRVESDRNCPGVFLQLAVGVRFRFVATYSASLFVLGSNFGLNLCLRGQFDLRVLLLRVVGQIEVCELGCYARQIYLLVLLLALDLRHAVFAPSN